MENDRDAGLRRRMGGKVTSLRASRWIRVKWRRVLRTAGYFKKMTGAALPRGGGVDIRAGR